MEITATIRSGLRTAGSCVIPTLAALFGDSRRANRPVNRVRVEQSYPSVQRFSGSDSNLSIVSASRSMSIVSCSSSDAFGGENFEVDPQEEVRSKPELSDRVISKHSDITSVNSEGYTSHENAKTIADCLKFFGLVEIGKEDPRNDGNFDYMFAEEPSESYTDAIFAVDPRSDPKYAYLFSDYYLSDHEHGSGEEVKSKPEADPQEKVNSKPESVIKTTDPVKKDGFGNYLGVPCLPYEVDPRSDRKYDYLLAYLAPKVPTTDL